MGESLRPDHGPPGRPGITGCRIETGTGLDQTSSRRSLGMGQQLQGGPVLDDPPLVHHQGPVTVLPDQGEVVGDEQQPRGTFVDQPKHTVGEFRIQGAGRLIRQDEPGMMHGARRD